MQIIRDITRKVSSFFAVAPKRKEKLTVMEMWHWDSMLTDWKIYNTPYRIVPIEHPQLKVFLSLVCKGYLEIDTKSEGIYRFKLITE